MTTEPHIPPDLRDLPTDFDPNAETEGIISGRRYPFHVVGDWIALAIDPATGKRLSPQSRAMYSTLMMHVNHKRGDGVVWPGTAALAELSGLSRADKVKPWIDPLVRIQAVEVHVIRWGERMEKSRNIYVVHETPPPGYQGMTSLAEFYADRDAHAAEMAETEGEVRRQRGKRGVPEIGVAGVSRKNARKTLEPPKSGVPDSPETGAPGTPETGHQPHEHLNHHSYNGGEEEAAHARAREDQPAAIDETAPAADGDEDQDEQLPELPDPSLFALLSIRQIIDEAPHTTGRGEAPPEHIGEAEVYAFARAFDAESERLREAGVYAEGSVLSGWLSRGLESADSLFAILEWRLTPGRALAALTRPKKRKKDRPAAAADAPAPTADAAPRVMECTVHPGVPLFECAECAAAEEKRRQEHNEMVRRRAEEARRGLSSGQGAT